MNDIGYYPFVDCIKLRNMLTVEVNIVAIIWSLDGRFDSNIQINVGYSLKG